MTLAYVPPAAPAPVAVAAQDCPRGSRDCFPEDLTAPSADAGRGSGRVAATVAYRVWFAGFQELRDDATGEPIDWAFVTDNLVLDVPSGGAFGFGEQAYINDWVALNLPGMDVMETKTLAAEFAEF